MISALIAVVVLVRLVKKSLKTIDLVIKTAELLVQAGIAILNITIDVIWRIVHLWIA